jgi:exo-beta-1,3-glucanase (GH17 family)
MNCPLGENEMSRTGILISTLFMFSLITSCSSENSKSNDSELKLTLLSKDWPGRAIAYSGYREGQDPRKKIYPIQEQIIEDLKILEKHWKIIRTYGADQHSLDILEVIKRENIGLKVMLGIWLDGEPDYINDNEKQVEYGIELTNKYRDVVIAVSVGNESQVHWSDHKVPNEKLISYINEVKSKVSVPVTTADTWDYWLDLEKSADLIDAADFVAVHIYPIWGKLDIDQGMSSTIETYNKLITAIPSKKIVIAEAGWATYTEGDLHVPQAGDEKKQKRYFNELMKWSWENNVPVFWFEAFDEPWKGTGTEGHWGLFNVDRKAKLAMHDLYPDFITDQPTSPNYK